MPRDVSAEACSGLVGVAIGTASAQSENGYVAEILGWNPNAPGRWTIGSVAVTTTSGWSRARLGPYDFRITAPLLAQSLRAESPDVLHAYTDPHLLLGPSRHLKLLHYQTPVPEFPGWAYTHLVNRADAVVCCGRLIREEFLERVRFPAERVFEVHNGLDLARFEHTNGAELRREWGIPDDVPVVLFAGALVPEKGLHVLLEAVSGIEQLENIEIVVAGSASLWLTPENTNNRQSTAYENQIRQLASGLRMRWLGPVPASAMAGVYAAADVCVVPSTWDEPFGMVACEAMAAGTPVIASARGGLSQIVEQGETGLLVPSSNPEALRSALLTLISNTDWRLRIGANARERAREFSWESVARRLDDIYSEVGLRFGGAHDTDLTSAGVNSEHSLRRIR